MIDWQRAETAIVSWVRGALAGAVPGLTVAWAYQTNVFAAVVPPAVVLAFSSLAGVDRGEARQFLDENADTGIEIEERTTRYWLATLLVEIRTANVDVTGAVSPHALATQLLTDLRRDDVQEALQLAGLGLVDDGEIEFEPELYQSVWQPRATVPVRFYVATVSTDRTGYLAEYRGEIRSGDQPAQQFTFTPEADIEAEE